MSILLTGVTGFLGAHLAKKILCSSDARLWVITRRSNGMSAQERVRLSLNLVGVNVEKLWERVGVFEGDIAQVAAGLSGGDLKMIMSNVEHIYHCAAITDFECRENIIFRVNTEGTKNIIDVVAGYSNKGTLKSINYISTAYVAGDNALRPIFYEDDLFVNQLFHNNYEKSKFQAEVFCDGSRRQGLPINILRTGVIIGDSEFGKATNTKGFYQLVRILSSGLYKTLPADPSGLTNLVPVNQVVDAILEISKYPTGGCRTYHLTNPQHYEFGNFVKRVCAFLNISAPELIPANRYDFTNLSPAKLAIIKPFVPYMNYKTYFDTKYSAQILSNASKQFEPVTDSLLNTMFTYCVSSGFIQTSKYSTGALSFCG